jgi:hypothetical protein
MMMMMMMKRTPFRMVSFSHILLESFGCSTNDAMLGLYFELKATDRKSGVSHIKKNAWPNKKARVTKSTTVSK